MELLFRLREERDHRGLRRDANFDDIFKDILVGGGERECRR